MKQKGTVCSRIRNARASLDNAERSFSSNQAVRGELDLMLAEAELQNLRKRRDSRFSWTRQTLAAGSAFLLLTAAGLGWWWASVYPGGIRSPEPIPSVAAGTRPVMTQAVGESDPAAVKEPVPAVSAGEPLAAGSQAVSERLSVPPEKASPSEGGAPGASVKKTEHPAVLRLSSGQLRQLVRSGRQELNNPH